MVRKKILISENEDTYNHYPPQLNIILQQKKKRQMFSSSNQLPKLEKLFCQFFFKINELTFKWCVFSGSHRLVRVVSSYFSSYHTTVPEFPSLVQSVGVPGKCIHKRLPKSAQDSQNLLNNLLNKFRFAKVFLAIRSSERICPVFRALGWTKTGEITL